jgi:hypothetical protein
MPNRYIREAAIKSEAVNGLSWQGEVFWRRLINLVDDFGRYTAHLKLLRADVFPLQIDKVSERDVVRLLAECEEAGLLFVYKDSAEKPYLAMNKWEKGRAHESIYPPPPENICERMKTFVYRGKQKYAAAPDSDSDSDSDSDTNTDTEAANLIYSEYPKKAARPDALRAINKALKKASVAELIAKTRAYAQASAGQNPKYIPHPASWFNAERYNDDPATWFSTNGDTATSPRERHLPVYRAPERDK